MYYFTDKSVIDTSSAVSQISYTTTDWAQFTLPVQMTDMRYNNIT